LPAFRSSAIYHSATCFCSHAQAKAVRPVAFGVAGLKCSFTHDYPLFCASSIAELFVCFSSVSNTAKQINRPDDMHVSQGFFEH
jgi:hypothetical protein